MSARPGHHNPDRRDQERGEDIRAAARTLARLLGTETHHDGWRGGAWRRQQMGWRTRSGPGRFHGPPPRNPRRTPERRHWQPYFYGSPRSRRNWQRYSPRTSPPDWRTGVLPRRGPPVAAIRAPRRYQHGLLEERRPCGSDPRGPLRGGPKGQPMIRRENLKAVCAEAPQGQPRKHRPHPRKQHSRVPRGKKPEKRGERRDPSSSRWRKTGGRRRREDGDHSHEPTHGVLAVSSRT